MIRSLFLLLLGLTACTQTANFRQEEPPPSPPSSVILLIGDGMGPQQVGLLVDWAEAAGRSSSNTSASSVLQ